MVTRPAVPPYSSTTITRWVRAACISDSRSSTGLDSGTNVAGRITSATGSAVAAGSPLWVRRTTSLR